MMFRRFLQRFVLQPWGSIATELAIVIIGVFIGMQVTNWNQAREDRIKGRVYTARLKNDMRLEAWSIQRLVDYSRQTNRYERRVLDAMSGDHDLSDEQFLISAYRASQYIPNFVYHATYRELVSSGNLGLITDHRLLETATMVYSTPVLDKIAREAGNSEYRTLFRETIPAAVQQALLDRCGDHPSPLLDYQAIRHTIEYPCTLGLDAAKIHKAVSLLKAQTRFVPALRIRYADNQTAVNQIVVQLKYITRRLQEYRH